MGTATVAQLSSRAGAAAAKPTSNSQARLILQDPLAYEQATQPALRSSMELISEPTALMEREKARQLWESLSLEPEVAQERQEERKRLLARADQLARESAADKARSVAFEAQLHRAKEDRLDHPVVYAGAAGLFALGALWLLERRKRIAYQDKERKAEISLSRAAFTSQEQSASQRMQDHAYLQAVPSVFSLEDPSDFGQDDVNHLGAKSHLQSAEEEPEWARASVAQKSSAIPMADQRKDQSSGQEADAGLLNKTKRAIGQLWTRPSQRNSLSSPADSTQGSGGLHTEGFDYSTVMHADAIESTRFLQESETQTAKPLQVHLQPAQPAAAAIIRSPEQDNIDLLTNIRALRGAGESPMEHLLELRMAAGGLSALERPLAAIALLQAHIEAEPQTCAWAYLECMQLCERIGERDIFESIRQRYRQQFNRMAPYWHEPNANVIGLDGYVRATSELCAAWSQGHQHAREVLTSWLTGPHLGRKLVQLPAYHDLFDLYEMLEFLERHASGDTMSARTEVPARGRQNHGPAFDQVHFEEAPETSFEFVPTVSLLDLDYEFSSDVTLQEREVAQSEKAVTIVKPGNFSVDFNVAGTQMSGLFSVPAELDKK
jgi:hypothetical protein